MTKEDTAADEAATEDLEQIFNSFVEGSPKDDAKESPSDEADDEDQEDPKDEADADEGEVSSKDEADADADADESAGDESAKEDQEDIEAKLKRLEQLHKTDAGRNKSTRKDMSRLSARMERLEKLMEKLDSAERKERREKLKDSEYGDVLEPLTQEMDDDRALLSEMIAAEKAEIDNAKEDADEHGQAEWAVFTQEHPDGMKVVTDDPSAFLAWVEDQPKATRDLFEKNKEAVVDGVGAALLLTKYKMHLDVGTGDNPEPKTDRKRDRQKKAAASLRAKTSQIKDSDDVADPDAVFNSFL